MAARDDYTANPHPGQKHVWILQGTDHVHGADRDVWMCQRADKCGRDTDPARRVQFMDKAMRDMAAIIIGHPVQAVPGDPIK